MKRAFVVLIGVLIGLGVGAGVSLAFNTWYSPRFVRGDDDVNVLVTLLLFVFLPAFGVGGGIAANRLFSKRCRTPSA